MRIRPLHRWNVDAKEAVAIQKKLASKVRLRPLRKTPEIIAGTDLSFSGDFAFAGAVLLEYPSMKVVDEFVIKGKVPFPYVPGLLSFREAPLLLQLMEKVRPEPDLIFMDGQGIAHPRKLGLASHIGLFLNKPCIGCAKSRLTGHFREPGHNKGAWTPLLDDNGEPIGGALRSRNSCKPIFISPGHLTDINQSVEFSLACATRYRIPEPTRLAHLLVARFKRGQR